MANMTAEEYAATLLGKIKTLNERLWEKRANKPLIDAWLENFAGEEDAYEGDRIQALYLLSQFIFFGTREVRELLRALYRDQFRYPVMARLRETHGDSTDVALLHQLYQRELTQTRFLGVGSPAESGTHLLYYFRQENRLDKNLFVSLPGLYDRRIDDPAVALADSEVRRIVFLDDLCGSGTQASKYSMNVLPMLRELAERNGFSLEIEYLVLIAERDALAAVARQTNFDRVGTVLELDETHKCLSPASRHFHDAEQAGQNYVTRESALAVARSYGETLWPSHPLGWRDSQLLLGFSHNIPDNTLPIMWFDQQPPPWKPIFPRYPKIES
jgi:hypothetical protein